MAKKSKSKKKTSKKRVAKTRKPNRYNEIRKVVSKYCKERYNHSCTNAEMNRIYSEIKARFFDKGKSPPLREIIRNIDVILEFKDKNTLPSELMFFQWFSVDEALGTSDGLFFNADDTIILDFSAFGIGEFKMKHKDMSRIYYDEIYPEMRKMIKEVETEKGKELMSPPPELEFDNKSNQKQRIFRWSFNLDENLESVIDDVLEKQGKKTKRKKKSKVLPSATPKPETQPSNQVKRNEQKIKALELLRKDFDDGIFTVEEYKKERSKILDTFKKGGQIE